MSVQTLISSPLTENMIAKAILQSGGSYGKGLTQDFGHEQALSYGEKIIGLAGVHSLEELRIMQSSFTKRICRLSQRGS